MFTINKTIITVLLLPFSLCISITRSYKTLGEPYIDSTGYRAASRRLEIVDHESSNKLISQALSISGDSNLTSSQPEYFQSLEESYQRYSGLFTYVKRAPRPEVRCPYDLIETFRLQIFDPQPFVNAILHAMKLSQLTTLDFTVETKNTDTMLVHIAFTKSIPQHGTRWFSLSEGELTLAITRHSAVIITPLP